MIPSAVAYLFFGRPLIAFLFEYGKFTSEYSALASPVLACYAIGLPFIGLARILGAACYAVKQPGVPLRSGVASVTIWCASPRSRTASAASPSERA